VTHTPALTPAWRRDLLPARRVQILTILGFAIPIVAYLWYLHHYGLNVVYGDQWDTVSRIGLSYRGRLTLSSLWAQHNENRIFFPNLIALTLSRVAAFNLVLEQYLGAGFLFGAIALIIGAHKRRCPYRTWLAYCPVVILMLSVVQGDNTLSGFQIAWYVILATLAGVIFILDREMILSIRPTGEHRVGNGGQLLVYPGTLHLGRGSDAALLPPSVAVARCDLGRCCGRDDRCLLLQLQLGHRGASGSHGSASTGKGRPVPLCADR
jgi:hypothetical protein